MVEEIIKKLEEVFGSEEAPLTICHGKVHDHLCMTLDFSKPKKVLIKMFDYIKKLLKESPPDMNGESNTLAANHLFTVNLVNPKLLDEETAELFHHFIAKLLFLSKRATPDIQMAVAFLSTRVKQPDVDNYKKLTRVICYLRHTAWMPFTLEAGNMCVTKWFVDTSHVIHPDMKGHTGRLLTLGKGAVYAASLKQKLNTRSMTKIELVGTDNILPKCLWTMYFMKVQGWEVKDNLLL